MFTFRLKFISFITHLTIVINIYQYDFTWNEHKKECGKYVFHVNRELYLQRVLESTLSPFDENGFI